MDRPTEASTAGGDTPAAEVLARGRQTLAAAGVDAPWLAAQALLESVLQRPRSELLAHPELPVAPAAVARFEALVRRRAAREPLAYLLGHREFYGRDFEVTPATLIPRPETEGLVELALASLQSCPANEAVWLLDIGTGTGAVAVTLLLERPVLRAVGTDVSAAALAVAARNAQRHHVAARLHLVQTNLADGLRVRFDLVVANLPYIPSGEIGALEPEVAVYEPRAALDGGPSGAELIEALLDRLDGILAPGGVALIEHGDGQAPLLRQRAQRALAGATIRSERDLAGVERYLTVEGEV